MSRPWKIHETPIKMNDTRELYLRRKIEYMSNCIERFRWMIHAKEFKKGELSSLLESLTEHIADINTQFIGGVIQPSGNKE